LNKIKWIIFGSLAVGIIVFLILLKNGIIPSLEQYKDTSTANVDNVNTNGIDTVSDNSNSTQNGGIADHIYGNENSKVTLVEYGDYQCPPCASIYPSIKSVVEKYKDKIRFVFRNFPITSIHANAKTAAATAEAAGLQGKYWEMHDKIYEGQKQWSDLGINERAEFFTNYARELGLDINKFTTDMASKSVSTKISYDYAIGTKVGVEGTPSFYLNGKKLDSTVFGDQSKLSATLDAEIAKN